MKSKPFMFSVRSLYAAGFALSVSLNPAFALDFTSGNSFESDAGGWTNTTRVSSGTGGITSADGSFHAKVTGGGFTRWGGYKSEFPAGGFTTSVSIYLDMDAGTANDTRFCLSSAVSNTTGGHLRDFVFNAGFYTDTDATGSGNRFVISASNGAGRSSAYPKNPGRSPQAITASGWYAFEHVFQDVAGVLSVTLNIRNSSNDVVATWTLSTPADLIPSVVGGNRYGWFAQNEFPGGVAIDNTEISSNATPSISNLTKNIHHLAISSAINEADAGNVIRIGSGSYTENLLVDKSLTIQGANSGVAAGSSPGSRGAESVINGGFRVTQPGVVLDGLNVKGGTNSGSVKVGVAVAASGVTITNSIIEDVLSPAQSDGVATETGVNNLTLSSCTIRNNWRGIYLNPGSGHTLVGNLIDSNNGVGVGIGSDGQSDLTLTNNTISNHTLEGWGASGVGVNVAANENSFTSNTVSVAHYGGQAIDASANYWGSAGGPGSTVSGNVEVFPYYTDAERTNLFAPVRNSTQNTYFGTIQAAVTAASPNDVIELSSGDFSEAPVDINKGLTIRGPNAGLSGTAPGRSAEARILNTRIFINAPGVVIDGVQIQQTDNTQDAILMQAPATVRNSVIKREGVTTGNSVRGITTAVGVAGFTFEGNLFTGDPSGGFFSGHKTWNSGMYVNGGSGTITGNTFENCRTAINLDDFNAGIVVTGNTFTTCGTYLAFGGTTPTSGSFAIAGNDFGVDFVTPGLPSAIFSLSNVATTFRLAATGNTFGGVASGDLTNSQKFVIEARNFHRGRASRNGVADFVANQQVVMPGTTIQSAVNAAAPGDSVLVGPGSFAGNISIGKALTLTGSGAGTSTVVGVSDSALGSVQVLPGAGAVTIEGLSVIGIDGPAGLEKAAVYLQGNQSGVTVRNNTITANGDAALMAEWGAVVSNLTIDGNLINGSTFNPPGTGGTAGDQFTTPNWPRSLVYIGGPGKTNVVFTDNTVNGVSGDSNNSNVMINLDAAGTEISGNTFGGDTGSRPGVAVLRARGSSTTVDGNVFTGTSSVALLIGSGSSDTAATSSVSENNFIAPYDAAVVNAGASALDATHNYWGAADGPEGDGSPVAGNVAFSPWYADEARTILVTAANFEAVTVPSGTSVVEGDLYIGGSYKVNGTLEVTGDLNLAPGAVLEVVNGSLTVNGSTLSGTFSFFNSFGSVDFNDDVTISGSASGLILISDVHVADGATITVDGTLVIDGCVIDCQTEGGSYDINVNAGASFTMARSVMIDGALNLGANDSKVYDNRFESSTIAVATGTAGARVYHNLTDSLGWLTDNGAGTVTTVDGWGNVTTADDTENNLLLGLDLGALGDLANGRSTVAGDIYIQPSDAFTASLDVSDLQAKIAAVEVLLGYNTGMLAASPLALENDWDLLISGVDDDSTVIGKLDGAIGLSFDFVDPEGSDDDQTIATVGLTGQGVEGETLFFQRVKLAGDAFGGDTRLTTGGGSPAYLAPFTANSASIFIDGTAPALNVSSANAAQVQESGTVDVLDPAPAAAPAYVHRNGQPLVISFTAADTGLAGLDAADALNDLQLSATNGTTLLNTWTVSALEDPLTGVVTYTVTLTVPSDATNGVYHVSASVRDRSGNWSAPTTLGAFEITYELLATVQLQGFVGANRELVFVATNSSGTVLATWTKTLAFTGDTASTVLDAVPAATSHISAKTAWNLRSKVAAAMIENGIGTAVLTGADQLPGGDLNGDNVVNTLDYSILRFNWLSPAAVANINGDGVVNLADYNIQKGNFYSAGDPQ